MNKFLAGLTALFLTISSASAQVIPIGGGGSSIAQTTGTCIPTIYGSTTPGTSTYVNQDCSYIKTGDEVTVNIFVRGTLGGTAAGNVMLGGLPFTIYNTAPEISCAFSSSRFVTLTALYTQIGLIGNVNTTTLSLVQSGSGQLEDVVPVAGWGTNAFVKFTCTYRAT